MDYMERLQCISDDIWEEMHTAKHYLHLAQKLEDADSSSADHYYNIAKQEVEHAEILCQMGDRVASMSCNENIKEVWQWQHDNIIRKKTEVMARISLFKK